MNRRLFLLLPLLALTLATLSGQCTNQKKDKPRDTKIRNVEGIVSLPDGTPATGAVVQLKNVKTLQVRSFITQENGKYVYQNLSTNIDYELKADYKEYASPVRTLTVFDTRLDAIVNLKLEPKKSEEKKP